MKKFKIVLWLIIIALLILVFFQNKAFFIGKQALMLDLYVTEPFQSLPLPIAVWLLVALVIGFLFAYFLALVERFKTNRLLKGLKAKLESQEKTIAQMKQEMAANHGYSSNEVVNGEAIGMSASGSETHKIPSDD